MKHRMTLEQMEMWYARNIDIDNRVIYFGPWQPNEEMVDELKTWEVNDWSAQNFIKGLYILERRAIANITIVWCSYGGDWTAGMAMYDYLKRIKSKVTIEAYGRIRSMGTIILQAAHKRLLSPNCEFLLHYGTYAQDVSHAKDAKANIDEVDRNNKTMEDIYLKRIKEKHKGYTREKLSELIKYDKFLLPKEAVEKGFADGIIYKERRR